MEQPLLSIIIVNYNTGDFLKKCLASVKRYVPRHLAQVFIVDNCSTDESFKPAYQYPEYTLIKNKKNTGFCEANNQVLQTIKTKYAVLLNPDTELTKRTFERMIAFMEKSPKIGVIGPKVLYPDGRLQLTAFSFPSLMSAITSPLLLDKLFPHSKIFNKRYLGHWDHKDIKEVDAVSGCCLFLRKKVYDQIGGLDLLFLDDIDFCKRAKDKGWQVVYFPKSKIYHFGGGSFMQNRYVPVYFTRTSQIKYFKKYHGSNSACFVSFIILMEILCRLPIETILYAVKKQKINQSRLQAYGGILKFIFSFKY